MDGSGLTFGRLLVARCRPFTAVALNRVPRSPQTRPAAPGHLSSMPTFAALTDHLFGRAGCALLSNCLVRLVW